VSYDQTFYDNIRAGCQSSADAVVPLVIGRLGKVESVVDVGCGEGWWASAFARRGCTVLGVDGAHVQTSALGDRFVARDLAHPLNLGPLRFDLAVCLEVAEHLPESRAAGLVSDLCQLAPVVLFSAAVPHQTGAGHVNLQWPSYWAELFRGHGYDFDGSIRFDIWEDRRVEPWYRQNLHIATAGCQSRTYDLVHPLIHEWGR
jgi:SAM-dependent methyltransferase